MLDLTPEDHSRYVKVRRDKIMKSTYVNEQRHLPANEQGLRSIMGRVDYRRVPDDVLRDALNETTDQGEEFTEAFLNFYGAITPGRAIGRGMFLGGEPQARKTA